MSKLQTSKKHMDTSVLPISNNMLKKTQKTFKNLNKITGNRIFMFKTEF